MAVGEVCSSIIPAVPRYSDPKPPLRTSAARPGSKPIPYNRQPRRMGNQYEAGLRLQPCACLITQTKSSRRADYLWRQSPRRSGQGARWAATTSGGIATIAFGTSGLSLTSCRVVNRGVLVPSDGVTRQRAGVRCCSDLPCYRRGMVVVIAALSESSEAEPISSCAIKCQARRCRRWW